MDTGQRWSKITYYLRILEENILRVSFILLIVCVTSRREVFAYQLEMMLSSNFGGEMFKQKYVVETIRNDSHAVTAFL